MSPQAVSDRGFRAALGGFFGHVAAIVLGFFLIVVGLALGVTMVLLPVGIVVGLTGVLILIAGLFARINSPD